MRTLVPAETLVYLETNDLAAALQPIVDAKPFVEAAKSKPDLSALKGIQFAVAVTGFETKEEVLTDEQSVGRIQPRFVAVAETHAWNYQAVAFAETKLGQFVTDIYGTDVTEERVDSANGKELTWISADGRKSYALVTGSIIYFTNDETAIEKCLAVKRGESDSILKTNKIKQSDPGTLARGYVTTDGIAQIANIVSLKIASEASDESEVQSALAGTLPQLVRKSVTDASWTSTKTSQGVEDKYQIGMPLDTANLFSETMISSGAVSREAALNIPEDFESLTRYNLKNFPAAWQSIQTATQKSTDLLTGKVIEALFAGVLQQYGIDDADSFLTSVGSQVVTVKFGDDPEKIAVISTLADKEKLKQSISKTFKFSRTEDPSDRSKTISIEGDMAFALSDGQFVLGELTAVNLCWSDATSQPKFTGLSADKFFNRNDAAVVTLGRESSSEYLFLIDLLATPSENPPISSMSYLTETRFTKSGMERRTVSDFGLIGQIIAQLDQD